MTKLTIEQFGEALLTSGDLDPMYLAVNKARLDYEQLNRLMLSYFCFYHLGAAARMAEARTAKDFWKMMLEAATYSPVKHPEARAWPRGAERRHYRGDQARKSMLELDAAYNKPKFNVAGAVGHFIGAANTHDDFLTFGSISKAVQTHRGFGTWIAFKVADVAERVLGYDVDFKDCHLGIYKDPREGAAVALLALDPAKGREFAGKGWEFPITDDQLERTVAHYATHFSKIKARGLERKVNVQEVETIFCKYKSHLKGHYPVGKDSEEIRHGLEGWGDLADELRKGIPDEVWTKVVMEVVR